MRHLIHANNLTIGESMIRKLFSFALLLLLFLSGCKSTTGPDDRVQKPDFSPGEGTFTTPQSVIITTATPGATIYYTTDGSTPNSDSMEYSNPILINCDLTLKAICMKEGMADSPIRSGTYRFHFQAPEGFVTVMGGYVSGISVNSFYMAKYEVTQTPYTEVMGKNPSYFQSVENAPVERVSWLKAIEYCNRRSILEGLNPCYTYGSMGSNPDDWPEKWFLYAANHTNIHCSSQNTGYRLPTEAEWVYAARGGLLTNGYVFSGGNNLNELGWYWDNWGQEHLSTHSVGALIPNELGIFDMSGNVWEWCWDIHSGTNRVHLGGSWVHSDSTCAISFRCFNAANYASHYIGIRLVRSV
ncbi:MAG: transcriptional regulator [Candidatus Cloacimonetes bacterium HGW-Cloacimonetes-2]|nr:MAG: transcriptional regulator [Candidatus Cloacimonetes bacterium HGW-Cloacimonetes-2]